MPLPPASSSLRGVPVPSKKKLKYHERLAFLRRESILELEERGAYAQGNTRSPPNAPWCLGKGISESYRLAATLHRSAEKAALKTRPFSWGYGSTDGALGHNRTTRVGPMKMVAAFRHHGIVRSVSAGNRLSLFLTDAGDVYQCGRLYMRQDGCGMWKPRKVDFELEHPPRIVAVVAGHLAGYALDDQGQVYSWGTQCYGQLGFEEAMNTEENGLDHADEGTNHSDAIKTPMEDDKDKATDSEGSEDDDDEAKTPPPPVVVVHKVPQLVSGLGGIKFTKLAAGNHFAIAISSSGHVYSWGRGNCGQLGLGKTEYAAIPARIDALADWVAVDVACGHSHALGIFVSRLHLSQDASVTCQSAWDYTVVYAWGSERHGQLGLGFDDGHAQELSPGEVTFFRGLNAMQVAAGHDHSLVLCGIPASQSFLYGFGGNQYGQLGIATSEDHVAMPSYVSEFANVHIARIGAGARCSVVLTGDGELFTWGDAMHGKAGRGDSRTTFTPWKLEPPDSINRASGAVWKGNYVTQVSMGSHHALGLLRSYGDDMDRWRKFPLGPLASYLHLDEGVDASFPSFFCVCEASQSTTSSVFGIFVGCNTCNVAPICRLCARRCHHQHTLKPIALGTRQQQAAPQCACAKMTRSAAQADEDDNGDKTDLKPTTRCVFADRPMRIQEDELLVLRTKSRKARFTPSEEQ
uniref:B box-type domain-containing protein n=1 Tax=Globisporangium ultimum (strain ATCC 200006 / CBS 805.95 / DAOM BR144) TaxID=431595 RepID=K3WC04_GLOUD